MRGLKKATCKDDKCKARTTVKELVETPGFFSGIFEEEFAKMVGHKYAIAVTSASHGQDLVMKAMGWKGIDVINPAISFIATAMIPLWNNFTTNIVDVKRDTLCIDPQDVEKYKKPNSEVLIAVDEGASSKA